MRSLAALAEPRSGMKAVSIVSRLAASPTAARASRNAVLIPLTARAAPATEAATIII